MIVSRSDVGAICVIHPYAEDAAHRERRCHEDDDEAGDDQPRRERTRASDARAAEAGDRDGEARELQQRLRAAGEVRELAM